MRTRAALTLAALLAVTLHAEAQVTLSANNFRFITGSCNMRSGSGAPASSLGAVCDVYVRTDPPYSTYRKTGVSTWTLIVAEPGSTGLTTVGALDTGSISTGFGAIDVGADGITGGTLTGSTSVSTPTLTAAANLTLSPVGDLVINPTGDDVLPTTNFDINIGSISTKFRELHVGELWVDSLVAADTIATIGGRVIFAPTTKLTSDLAAAATSMSVEHNALANGDLVLLQKAGRFEYIAIASSASGSGPYTYTVTRNADLTGANDWLAGDAVVNTGTTGNGYIDAYSLWSINQPQFSYVFNFNTTGSVYSSNYAESESWPPFGDGANNATNDAVYFGAGSTFSAISQQCSTGLVPTTGTFVWEFWNGSAWTSTSPTGTLAALGRNTVAFGTLTGWATTTVNGVSAYWVRVRLTNTPSPAMTAASCYLPARAARTWGPTLAGNVRTGTTYSNVAVRWAVGNLNGIGGYSTDTYGAFFGDESNTNVTADAANGFRIRSGTTERFKADTSGNLSITGDLSVGTSGLIRSGATSYSSGTGYVFDYNGGTPRGRIGTTAGNRVAWDGTDLTVVSDTVTIDTNGIKVASWNTLDTSCPGSCQDLSRSYAFSPASAGFMGLQGLVGTTSGAQELHLVNDISGGSAPYSRTYLTAEGTTIDMSSLGSIALTASSAVHFGAGTSDLTIFTNNSSTSANPYMRSDGNYLVIETRSAANGGGLYMANNVSFDIVMGFAGGTQYLYQPSFVNVAPNWATSLSQSTVGATGAASALPANPAGYIKIKVNGTNYVVPAYNP